MVAEPEVDCVIPTHGRPRYLREALGSVLAQTRPPVRVTVVADDGGAGAREVVEELSDRRPGTEVVLLRRDTGAPGASASRNVGAATGDAPLLAFLDDDDTWRPDYLERAVGRLVDQRVDVVVTAVRKFSTEGPLALKVPVPGLDARGAFRRSPGMTGSNVVLLRSVFHAVGGFDPSMPVQNDRDLFLRLLLGGASYAVEPAPLVGVRQHGQGRLTDATATRADGILLFEAKHGHRFSWWDRRTVRYTSHYTRMSAASSRSAFTRSALAALLSWSPTVARDLPLDLLDGRRVRKLVRELVGGTW
jgi:glycosyltransferase involved in cell wall biosynthesis